MADGLDYAYIADVAVCLYNQRRGLGTAIIGRLVAFSQEYKKIILYANPRHGSLSRKLAFSA